MLRRALLGGVDPLERGLERVGESAARLARLSATAPPCLAWCSSCSRLVRSMICWRSAMICATEPPAPIPLTPLIAGLRSARPALTERGQAVAQRALADAELARGLDPAAAAGVERLHDRPRLGDLHDLATASRRPAPRARRTAASGLDEPHGAVEHDVLGADLGLPGGEEQRAVDDVLELADVARPVVARQQRRARRVGSRRGAPRRRRGAASARRRARAMSLAALAQRLVAAAGRR